MKTFFKLFNRHTAGTRYPVVSTDTRESCIKCGMTAVIFALFVATPSFATPTELDKKTVASKAYVDTKQDIIETGLVDYYSVANDETLQLPSLVSYDSTSGLVGNKIGILDFETIFDDEGELNMYNDDNFENREMDNFVPTVRAVANALQNIWNNMPDLWTALTWNSAETASTNAYDITFVGYPGATANAWPWADKKKLINTAALAQGLALKQNKIPAGTSGNVVTYTGTAGSVGSLGILQFGPGENEATIAYSATFDDDENNWPSDDATKLINGTAFAYGLTLKQNKLPQQTTTTNYVPKGAQTITLATSAKGAPGTRYITAGGSVGLTTKSGAPAIIGYVNGTAVTDSTAMTTFTTGTFGSNSTANQNYIKNALVSLELLKDVYSELNTKITNNALPTGTTGTVVTYNGTNATTGVQEFTETAMTGTVTYTNGTLDNANDIATITAVGTRQKKKECGGYEPAAAGQPAHDGTHPGDEDYCWLWIFPED